MTKTAGVGDPRHQLSAERRQVVAESIKVRRRANIAIALMSLVVVLGVLVLGLLVRADESLSNFRADTEAYSNIIEEISHETGLLLTPEYRAAAPPALIDGIKLQTDQLFEEERIARETVESSFATVRQRPNQLFAFVSRRALDELGHSVIDPHQLAVAARVSGNLLATRDAPLTSGELELRDAIRSGEFRAPAQKAESLVDQMIEQSRNDFYRYTVIVGLVTLSALASILVVAFLPAMRSERDLVTALDRHAAAVEHSYTQASAAQRIARLGYWYKTGPGDEIECSPQLAAMLTTGPAPRTTAALAALTSSDDDETLAVYEQLSQTPGGVEMTHTISNPGGDDLTLRERVESFPSGDSIAVTGVMLDISDITTAQQVIHRMEKLEIVDLLISGIAHDFNNLLGIIMGNAELALPTAQQPADRHLRAIVNASESAAGLILQLRQTAIDPLAVAEDVVVADAVQRLLATVTVPPNVVVDLVVDDDASDAAVTVNPSVFGSSLVNLMKNAFEAIGTNSGRVHVRVGLSDRVSRNVIPARGSTAMTTPAGAEADQAVAATPLVYSSRSVKITVSDDGPGMNERVRRRVLQPFFTTKARTGTKHSGLGLWSVFSFVKAWSGTIEITSEPGEGTTIAIGLPMVATGRTSGGEIHDVQKFAIDGRVLLVEDVDELLDVSENALRKWGLEVIPVSGFAQAAHVLRTSNDIRAVVSDVRLGPGATGFDLAVLALEHDPPIGVVLVSGAFGAEEVPDALQVPSCVFLPKPFNASKLHHALDVVLQQTAAVSAN